MKILKYKRMSNGKYKLFLDDGSDVLLYEESILKFQLLLKGNISDLEYDDIIKYNNFCDVYYYGMKSLKSRFKSVKELKELLIKKNYLVEDIDMAIDKLLKQGYLDDNLFSLSYINNKIQTSNVGPFKIKRELLSKGVDCEFIDKNILTFSDDLQKKRVNTLINKFMRLNRSRGGNVLKNKISNDLINLGYDRSIIIEELNKYEFVCDKNIYDKEYAKLYSRLSKKYTGVELEYKIKQKLFQKGLYYEN